MHRHLAEDEAVGGGHAINPYGATIAGLEQRPAGSGGQEVVRVSHRLAWSDFDHDHKVNVWRPERQLTGIAIGS